MSILEQVNGNTVAGAYESGQAQKKAKVSGKTIGNPELSEKAQKYYEELKKKYSNMDFILVSAEKKDQAKAQAGNYANANKMVVLIDEEKVERMAEDEKYRSQYEDMISSAASQLPQLQSSIGSLSTSVKTIGMQINDNGTASYFAVIDKSLSSQRERIEKKAEEKREDKKSEKKEEQSDTITVKALSFEDLIQKISDALYTGMSDNVQTESEKQMGQHIDFRM